MHRSFPDLKRITYDQYIIPLSLNLDLATVSGLEAASFIDPYYGPVRNELLGACTIHLDSPAGYGLWVSYLLTQHSTKAFRKTVGINPPAGTNNLIFDRILLGWLSSAYGFTYSNLRYSQLQYISGYHSGPMVEKTSATRWRLFGKLFTTSKGVNPSSCVLFDMVHRAITWA
jgi:hypothetical protein